MATIGHGLVGLSLAGLSRAKSRGNAMRFTWPGFMFLLGHVIDVIEWVTVILFANWADGHYLTHSPLMTVGFVAVVCGLVAAFGKVRRPWPYFLIAVCIFSHLALDSARGRVFLANLYGVTPEGLEGYSLRETVTAEIWLYGLMLLLVLLVRGVLDSKIRKRGKILTGVVAALAILAAATRLAAVWIPVYVLGYLHAGMMLRREIDLRMAWGGLFLIPLVVCVVSEVHASRLSGDAWALQMDQDYRGAIRLYNNSLAYPQRASPVNTLTHIGQCYDALGDLPEAERYFKKAMTVSEEPGWGHYWLAWFYANRNWQATPFYKPQEAMRILEVIGASGAREAVKTTAAGLLADLKKR